MKKILILAALVLCMGMYGYTEVSAAPAPAEKAAAEVPETKVIRWARGMSGNSMVTVAKKLGYFDEVGLTIEEIPFEDDPFVALNGGKVDMISNEGTDVPLQQIAVGEEVTIIGGHLLTGCMPIIAKTGTGWNGIGDLIGKKVACPPNQFALTGPLLDAGYDPLKEIEWIQYPTLSDRVAAVVKGEVDYGVIGTGMMYTVQTMKEVEILTYLGSIMPNYSCCRLVARTSFIEENPVAAKLMLKALLRAQRYYEANKDEVVGWMAEELGATKEYVGAYMLNEDYKPNLDPVKNIIVKDWEILDKTGFLNENAKAIKVEDHINTALYKAALDEVVSEHKDEDPAFYDKMLKFYDENNL